MILEGREASADDIAAACELWLRAEAARTGVPAMADAAREFAGSMAEAAAKTSATLLVGWHDEHLVATAFAIRLRADPAAAQVAMLAVEPQYWGCGAGSRMLAELTTRLSELGCERLRMNVAPDNERARALYERHGWTHTGEVEQISADQPAELIYRYTIPAATS